MLTSPLELISPRPINPANSSPLSLSLSLSFPSFLFPHSSRACAQQSLLLLLLHYSPPDRSLSRRRSWNRRTALRNSKTFRAEKKPTGISRLSPRPEAPFRHPAPFQRHFHGESPKGFVAITYIRDSYPRR